MNKKIGMVFISIILVLGSISNVFAETGNDPIPQIEPVIGELEDNGSSGPIVAMQEVNDQDAKEPAEILNITEKVESEIIEVINKVNDPSGILGIDFLLPDGSIAPMGSVFNFFSNSELAKNDGDCAFVGTDNTLTCYWESPLQKAIDLAAENSTIEINGSFSEQVIIEKPITLQGAPGTKLNAPAIHLDGFQHDEGWISGIDFPVLWIKNTSGVIIQGLELIGFEMDNWDSIGYGNQLLGIGVENSDDVNIKNNVITNFQTPKSNLYFGVGIGVFSSSNVTIEHNRIEQTNNAIEVEHSTNVVIRDNQLDKSSYGAIDRGTSKVGKNDGLYITYNQISNTPRNFIGCSGCGYVVQNYIAKNNYGLERSVQYIDTKGDNDNDGFWPFDNCVAVFNPDQADFDMDGIGNACDSTPYGDEDQDGIGNTIDNCIYHSNPGQADLDNNGIGDVCDPEIHAEDKSINNVVSVLSTSLIPVTGNESIPLNCHDMSRISLDNDFFTLIQPLCSQIVTFFPVKTDEIQIGLPASYQMLAGAQLYIQSTLENEIIGSENGSSVIGFEIPSGMDSSQMKILFSERYGSGAEMNWKEKNATFDGNVILTDAFATGIYILVYFS